MSTFLNGVSQAGGLSPSTPLSYTGVWVYPSGTPPATTPTLLFDKVDKIVTVKIPTIQGVVTFGFSGLLYTQIPVGYRPKTGTSFQFPVWVFEGTSKVGVCVIDSLNIAFYPLYGTGFGTTGGTYIVYECCFSYQTA